MAIVAQGQSKLVNLGPNDAIKVSTPGEVYVDHLSGTPESPYASTRLIKNTEPKVFGPYGANAQLRVRAIELSALYDGYTDPQPALFNTDPTTGQTVIVGPAGDVIYKANRVRAPSISHINCPAGSTHLKSVFGAAGDEVLSMEVVISGAISSPVQIKDGSAPPLAVLDATASIGTHHVAVNKKSQSGGWVAILPVGATAIARGAFQ